MRNDGQKPGKLAANSLFGMVMNDQAAAGLPAVAWMQADTSDPRAFAGLIGALRPLPGWCLVVRAPEALRRRDEADVFELLGGARHAGLAIVGGRPVADTVLVDLRGDLALRDGRFCSAEPAAVAAPAAGGSFRRREQLRAELETLRERCGGMAAEELYRQARQQALVAHLGRFALAETSISAFLAGFTEILVSALELDCAAVLTWDAAEDCYRVVASHGCFPLEPGARVTPELGSRWLAAARERGTPLLIGDFRADARFPLPAALLEQGFRSGLAIPLARGDREHGLLCALARRVAVFGEEDDGFFGALAALLVELVERRAGEQRAEEVYRALEQRVAERVRLLRLLKETADIANGCDDFRLALERCCEQVETALGWSDGRAVLTPLGERQLGECAAQLSPPPARLRDLGALDAAECFFCELIAASQRPELRRIDDAIWCGLPVVMPEGSAAVLCFKATATSEPDDTVVEALGHVGDQLSRMLERLRTRALTIVHLSELAHLDRIATMGELAAGLAHELGQPLGSITFYGGGLLRLLADLPAEAKAPLVEATQRILAESERAARVVQALRDFSRKEPVPLGTIRLDQVLERALELSASTVAKAGARVTVREREDGSSARGNALYVEQILMNLLLNAVEAVQGLPTEQRLIELAVSRSADAVTISVENPALGEPVDGERIFEPFYTTKPHGLGIGLSISRRLAEAQGGQLWIEPGKDRVRAYLRLPAAGDDAEQQRFVF